MSKRSIMAVLSAALFCSVSTICCAEDSVSQIASVTRDRNQELESLLVRYRIRSTVLGSAQDARKYLRLIHTVDEIKSFAFKGRKRYADIHRDKAEYDMVAPDDLNRSEAGGNAGSRVPAPVKKLIDELPAQQPKQTTKIQVEKGKKHAFNGDLLQRWHNDHKRIHFMGAEYINAQTDDLGHFNQEYMHLVFHSLPDIFNDAEDRGSHRLPDALKSQEVFVHPQREAIDGSPCIVIDIDNVRLWADPEIGYAVRRWQSRSAVDRGYVLADYQLSDFSKVTSKMWLPRKCVRLISAPADAPSRVKKRPLLRYEYTVKELQANNVEDSLFTLPVPPGSFVVDNINTVKSPSGAMVASNYRMPADPKYLDATIARARSDYEQLHAGFGSGRSRWALILGNLVVAALIGTYLWRRNS